jgi:hypothetical protein
MSSKLAPTADNFMRNILPNQIQEKQMGPDLLRISKRDIRVNMEYHIAGISRLV